MNRTFDSLLFLGTLALVACSSTTSTPNTSAATPIEKADLPAAYSAAVCDNLGSCCAQDNIPFDKNTSAACKKFPADYQAEIDTLTAAAGSGATYDATRAGECVAQTAALAKSCGANKKTTDSYVCDTYIHGVTALGAPCKNYQECDLSPSGKVACLPVGSPTSATKNCVLQIPGAVGAACTPNGEHSTAVAVSQVATCSSGSYCDDATSKCVSSATGMLALGQACKDTDVCDVSTSYCDLDGTKTCVAKKDAGQPCPKGNECKFSCIASSKLCSATHDANACTQQSFK